MLLVTGGAYDDYLATTEVLPNTGPGADGWREAGLLPSPRSGLTAARVGEALLVTGGHDAFSHMNDILTWDSSSESWSLAGRLDTARFYHGVTEVPLQVVADFCSGSN